MKIKGQDIIDFFKTWPPGDRVYVEEVPFEEDENGVLREYAENSNTGAPVDPAEVYDVKYGCLGWQGDGDPPSDFDDDFVRVLRKWLKAKTTTVLVVEVPNEEVQAAKDFLKSKGWKVKS